MAIHPTAIVSERAEIDPTAQIGPYVIVDGPVRIGPRTQVMPYAHISGNTLIGADNEIHMGCVIGHVPQHKGYGGEETETIIGDRNIIREYASIHRAFEPGGVTRIGSNCFLMGFSHVGHDCHVHDNVVLANTGLLAGHCEVMEGANISGGCVVHQFTRIGRLVMFQGNTAIGKDVPPFMLCRRVNEVAGVNVIGLRRAGFSADARKEVRQAYKILYRQGLSLPRAVERLRGCNYGPEVQEILDFIAASKRGICLGGGRREARVQDED